MAEKRIPLYERLPEIYKIKDQARSFQYKCESCGYIHDESEMGISFSELPEIWTCPGCGSSKEFFEYSGQVEGYLFKSYLSLVEEAFGEIHGNIESLYYDLFIETCDDWVIPYIGDLLGTSHLKGDPWTLRADVADTIALRRRKGTIGAIELLTYNLTQWGVHCVELRENLIWNQHLNHQRPDKGGHPPYGLCPKTTPSDLARKPAVRHKAVRGGTVTLRDPAMLSLLGTPFDPFGHTADLRPPAHGNVRYNIPNLAIFLWRLEAYQLAVSKPYSQGVHPRDDAAIDLTKFPEAAAHIARFDFHPLGEPVRLFNTHRFDPDKRPPVVTRVDETPGPIAMARLNEDSPAGNPRAYVAVDTYDPADANLETLDISDVGIQLHLPDAPHFPGEIWPKPEDPQAWSIRGANLCAWESGLHPPPDNREIVIDPVIGRMVIGVDTEAEGDALVDHLLITYTYGAVGPVGAHPISRSSAPPEWNGEPVDKRDVNFHQNPDGLRDALVNIQDSTWPIVIEIHDSMIHELDLAGLGGTIDEDGGVNLQLSRSLIIRAADNQRPVIRLAQPLRFRPTNVKGADEEEQKEFDAIMSNLTVRLEGLYCTRGDTFSAGEPLIARAALHSLEIIGCTLDPGGYRKLDGTRAPIHSSMRLEEPYGFTDADEEDAFNQTPEIIVQRSIAGPLFIDTGYQLFLADAVIDAGSGVNDELVAAAFAVSGAGPDPSSSWGPPTQANGITVFGRMRVESISARGGIWVHTLEVQNNQKGCIRFSYFSGRDDRLPQNLGCVKGTETQLRFVSEIFGRPAHGQLAHTSDFQIRERGPKDDAMGTFGFLLQAHKWRNIQIRFREFMPVGVRPLLIPVT